MLERSSALCVLTKANVDELGELTLIAPMALSYDSGDWEIAAGDYATKLLQGETFGTYNIGSHRSKQLQLTAYNTRKGEWLFSRCTHDSAVSLWQMSSYKVAAEGYYFLSRHLRRECLLETFRAFQPLLVRVLLRGARSR